MGLEIQRNDNICYARAFGFAGRLMPRAFTISDFFFFAGGVTFGITALTAFWMVESSCGSRKSAFLLMVMLEDGIEGVVFEDVSSPSGLPEVDEAAEEVPPMDDGDGPGTLENTLRTTSSSSSSFAFLRRASSSSSSSRTSRASKAPSPAATRSK